jgi:hypothetical protein
MQWEEYAAVVQRTCWRSIRKSDITPLCRLGNSGLTMTANVLFGAHFADPCYGYNAFWRDSLERFYVDASGFEVETELNLRAWKAGLTMVEVPSVEYDRIHGESNLNTWRDGWRVLKTMLRERLNWRRGLRGEALAAAAGLDAAERVPAADAVPPIDVVERVPAGQRAERSHVASRD